MLLFSQNLCEVLTNGYSASYPHGAVIYKDISSDQKTNNEISNNDNKAYC